MVGLLATLSLILVVVIVVVVAYHLIGIYVALKRGGDHLEKLAVGLIAIRDNTTPLNQNVDAINEGLSTLIEPLMAANGNLGAIVKVAGSR